MLLSRYISSVSLEEQKLLVRLSYQILLCQQKYFVVSPWSLIAAVLMQNKEGISFKQLVKQVEWLKRQASNLGAYIDWPGMENLIGFGFFFKYFLHFSLVSIS